MYFNELARFKRPVMNLNMNSQPEDGHLLSGTTRKENIKNEHAHGERDKKETLNFIIIQRFKIYLT